MDIETLIRELQKKAVEDASALDPAFKEQVEAERAAQKAHDEWLETQRTAQTQKTGPIEQRRPKPDDEGPSEKEILARVNQAAIERREL